MWSTKANAITKLKTILLIDLLVVAATAAGFFYVTSLPGPSISTSQIQFVGLTIYPSQAVLGQSVSISVNVTNVSGEAGTYIANLMLNGETNQNQTINLTPGETKNVQFTVIASTEGKHVLSIGTLEGVLTITNSIALYDLAINRTEAKVGEPIGISLTVTNRAQENGNYSVTLIINNLPLQTKEGQLNAGASTNVLFEIVEQAEGTYRVRVGSLNGTFRISSAAPPPKPAEFIVANLIIDPDVIQPGESFNVTARVTNAGEAGGSYTANLVINGEVKSSQTLQLSGGETGIVAFTATEIVKGSHEIKIGNINGTLSVQDPSTIKLTNLFVKPYEVWAGQTVTATVKGINTGSATSSVSLKLKITTSASETKVLETKTFTLAAGADGSVDFSIVAPSLQGSDSSTFLVDVNGMQGGFMVVKNGYHTLNVEISPRGDAKFTIILANGTSEEHTTFWSALLPEGTYTVVMPATDPTGRITFQDWDDGSTNPSRTFTLTSRMGITATFYGGNSCPSLYMWNGTNYVYVSDISNHGWLGYIDYIDEDGSIKYYRNNPWDYIPLKANQLKSTNSNYNLTLIQQWNEIFYLDQAYMMVVDHPAYVNVYSTMVEEYLDPKYMGQIYTVSKNPSSPVSAINQNGENILPQISKIDNVFTTGTNGIQSPAWDNITWNKMTLNLGNLTAASQIKLVMKAIVNWGAGEEYTTWLNKFFAQPLPNGTQVTPPPYLEIKDAYGNWMRIPDSREIPLPPDGVARTYVVDLTGLFPTNDYSLRISNFWNVTYDYIAVDTTPQQSITVQRIDPQAYLYQAFKAAPTAASGNFTKYGNVTQLIFNEDDMFVIGRQGDAVSLQFSTENLASPALGLVRDFFFYDACWFKDENGNWGFGFGFTVDPLPFRNMSGFPYPPNEYYPDDTAHSLYLQQWNTRNVGDPLFTTQNMVAGQNNLAAFSILALLYFEVVLVAVYATFKKRPFHSHKLKRI
jgi:hypothetical protein